MKAERQIEQSMRCILSVAAPTMTTEGENI
jgi:hypothetical protein